MTLESARDIGHHHNHFYSAMVAILILAAMAGFGTSYAVRATEGAPLPALVSAHAAAFSFWLIILMAQTLLIASGRLVWHRRLGIAAAAFAIPLIILAYETAVHAARHGHPGNFGPNAPFPDALAFLAVPLADLALFIGFLLTGLALRRRREAHRRLMLLAGLGGLAWPAITRIPGLAGHFPLMLGAMTLLLLALPVHDLLTRRRVHAASLVGAIVILASFPLRRAISGTDAWHAIAAWLTA